MDTRGAATSGRPAPPRSAVTIRRAPRLVRLASLVVPQRPAPWTVAGLGLLCGALMALFVMTLDQRLAPRPTLAWTVTAVVGTTTFAVGVQLLAVALRRNRFGPGFSWAVAGRLYGGYALAGAAAALVERGARSALDLPARPGVTSFLAHATWFWLVGLGANAFAVLRWRVAAQDVVLRQRVRDLDQTRALLAQADERVRREAAEVLHGRVQSRLLALEVQLEKVVRGLPADDPARRELLAATSVLEDLRVNDVRFTSHQLHPPTVRISLLSALRSLVATFEGNFEVDVELVASPEVVALDDPTSGCLDEPTRLVLYRVLEEALQNAHRHGRARFVRVELSVVAGARLQMRVHDDGAGFDPDAFTIGLGVASMAARVEDADGAWWIASAPGEGATVTVLVPLPSAPGAAAGPGPRGEDPEPRIAQPASGVSRR